MAAELKKVESYWSDRWRKVVRIYKCLRCGQEMSTAHNTAQKLAREHQCLATHHKDAL